MIAIISCSSWQTRIRMCTSTCKTTPTAHFSLCTIATYCCSGGATFNHHHPTPPSTPHRYVIFHTERIHKHPPPFLSLCRTCAVVRSQEQDHSTSSPAIQRPPLRGASSIYWPRGAAVFPLAFVSPYLYSLPNPNPLTVLFHFVLILHTPTVDSWRVKLAPPLWPQLFLLPHTKLIPTYVVPAEGPIYCITPDYPSMLSRKQRSRLP